MTFVAPVGVQKRTQWGAWLFALSVFGYPIMGNVVALLQLNSEHVTVPFRLAIATACLMTLMARGRMVFDGARLIVLACWMAYAARLVGDTFSEVSGAFHALQLFIFASALPALAQWKLDRFDVKLYAGASFIVISIGCISILVGNYWGLFGELDLRAATGRLSIQTLNAVSLGHLAVSGLLSGIVLWKSGRGSSRWIVALVMPLLLATLVLSGSKGPALVFAVLLLILASRGLVPRGTTPAVLVLSFLALQLDDVPLFERVRNISADQSTAWRIDLLTDSLLQIIDHPWIGSCFVEIKSGWYAHTIFLDAPMAIGVPLAIVLLFVMSVAARGAFRLLSGPDVFFGLLYLQGLVGSIFSGAMFGATLLWISLVIVLRLSAKSNVPPRLKQTRREDLAIPRGSTDSG